MEDTAVKVLVLRNKNTEMLLLLEKPNSVRPSMWGLPGGRSEDYDRNIDDVGFRETKEETGVEVIFDFKVQPIWEEFDGYKKAFIVAYYAGGELLGETEETIRCIWVSVDVLYNQRLMKNYCMNGEPDTMYPSHIRAARKLLSRLRGENAIQDLP